jgi:chromosome segregation ATPase
MQTRAKRHFFIITALLGLLTAVPLADAYGQTDSVLVDSQLTRLLRERAELTRRYADASEQRHSLFGNKPSKKDLQEVVDALQGIVDKDQQIVDVLNRTARKAQTTSVRLAATTTHLESTSRDDRNLTAQRLSELQNETQNLRQREKQNLARQRDLQAEVKEVKEGQFVRDALIAGLAVVSIGLSVALMRRGKPAPRTRK